MAAFKGDGGSAVATKTFVRYGNYVGVSSSIEMLRWFRTRVDLFLSRYLASTIRSRSTAASYARNFCIKASRPPLSRLLGSESAEFA
jgi:hypothetical protein